MKIKDEKTGETVELDESKRLTRENVVEQLQKAIISKEPTLTTMMELSFHLDFAISTKDVELIKQVHNVITGYYLDAFS